METYECLLLTPDGTCWSMLFQADDFAHAAEQCKDALPGDTKDELIAINRDYSPLTKGD